MCYFFDIMKKHRSEETVFEIKHICERIANELLMMLRLKKKTSREVSLYEPIGTDKEGNEICLVDIVEGSHVDLAEVMDRKRDMFRIYQNISRLTERERQVLSMRYGILGEKETTQREIAGRLGISRSYVSRIEKNALQKLRILLTGV